MNLKSDGGSWMKVFFDPANGHHIYVVPLLRLRVVRIQGLRYSVHQALDIAVEGRTGRRRVDAIGSTLPANKATGGSRINAQQILASRLQPKERVGGSQSSDYPGLRHQITHVEINCRPLSVLVSPPNKIYGPMNDQKSPRRWPRSLGPGQSGTRNVGCSLNKTVGDVPRRL